MEKILVAVDGSDHSQRAVNLAADIAVAHHAKLLLLHVVDDRSLSEEEVQLAENEYSKQIKRRTVTGSGIGTRAMAPTAVIPTLSDHIEADLVIRTALGEGILESARIDAASKGIKDVTVILENGDAASSILHVAQKNNVDLIVVGSRGQSDIKALFLGSVSHKVANLADVSVMAVK